MKLFIISLMLILTVTSKDAWAYPKEDSQMHLVKRAATAGAGGGSSNQGGVQDKYKFGFGDIGLPFGYMGGGYGYGMGPFYGGGYGGGYGMGGGYGIGGGYGYGEGYGIGANYGYPGYIYGRR